MELLALWIDAEEGLGTSLPIDQERGTETLLDVADVRDELLSCARNVVVFVPLLVERLRDLARPGEEDRNVEIDQCLLALGQLSSPRAARKVHEYVNSNRWDASALMILTRGGDPAVSETADRRIRDIGDSEIDTGIRELFSGAHGYRPIARAVVTIPGEFPDNGFNEMSLLRSRLGSLDPSVFARATWSLGRLNDEPAALRIMEIVAREPTGISIWALGRLAWTPARPMLRKIIEERVGSTDNADTAERAHTAMRDQSREVVLSPYTTDYGILAENFAESGALGFSRVRVHVSGRTYPSPDRPPVPDR